MTHFNNVIGRGNHSHVTLQEAYWNYYEADARLRAWTTFVMRELTGEALFTLSGAP
jgi:hypothetical protein